MSDENKQIPLLQVQFSRH